MSKDLKDLKDLKKKMTTLDYGSAPENSQEAMNWIKSHGKFELFIDGKWVAPKSKKYFSTNNSATNEKLGQIALADKKDVASAYQAARKAQKKWAALTGYQRSKYLYAIARNLQKNARLFSVLETVDNGKPIRESRDIDIPLVIRHFYYHAGSAQNLRNKFPNHQAHGVVGQIIPWNFPLLMLAWKIAPALATGNTVVLKPAEQTSLTALLFAELCQEIGLPPGVVNIITGDGNTGEALVAQDGFDKYAFTGSTVVGRKIMTALAGKNPPLPLTLELGGKSPIIVFEKADLDSAVEGVVDAIWFNQGEVCCAGSRLLLQEGIAEKFLNKLKRKMDTLRVGDPLQKNIDIGSIVSEEQWQRIDGMVTNCLKEEGEKNIDFYQPQNPAQLKKSLKGCFYPPTLLGNISTTSQVYNEEIFGPVLVSTTFRTHKEAVELANNTPYGLAASVWSEDINQCLGIAPELQVGVVWINSTNLFDATSEFGGVKETGYGREGGSGGLRAYLKSQVAGMENKLPKIKNPPKFNRSEFIGEIDKTQKLFIGGKQARPDNGFSLRVNGRQHLVGRGNRKDIRNAVEAADRARGWRNTTPSLRSQIVYYLAENMERRSNEIVDRLQQAGLPPQEAKQEVQATLERIFYYGGMAEQYEGQVHRPPIRGLSLALKEPTGIIGMVAPESSYLLAPLTMLSASLAMGNTSVIIASENFPLPLTDLYQVLETSDIPGGVINILTGIKKEMVEHLAGHYEVDAIWAPEEKNTKGLVSSAAKNLKRTFIPQVVDWYGESINEQLLSEATEIKTVWIPYGE